MKKNPKSFRTIERAIADYFGIGFLAMLRTCAVDIQEYRAHCYHFYGYIYWRIGNETEKQEDA